MQCLNAYVAYHFRSPRLLSLLCASTSQAALHSQAYELLTYFFQSCSSLNPSNFLIFRLDNGASISPISLVNGTFGPWSFKNWVVLTPCSVIVSLVALNTYHQPISTETRRDAPGTRAHSSLLPNDTFPLNPSHRYNSMHSSFYFPAWRGRLGNPFHTRVARLHFRS
jgi:hypothetical protein